MSDLAEFINPDAVRELTIMILAEAGNPKSPWLIAAALQHWVKINHKYIPDPEGNDNSAKPEETLAKGGGDCEDYSILFCSMCEAAGLQTKLHEVSRNKSGHVFTSVYCGQTYAETMDAEIQAFYQAKGIKAEEIFTFKSKQDGVWLLIDPQSVYAGHVWGLVDMGYFKRTGSDVEWTATQHIYRRQTNQA